MIAVFINNKLISCDSFLPVAMEINKRTGQHVHFFTTDAWTFEAIRKNSVLLDGISSIGSLTYLTRRGASFSEKLLNKIKTTWWLMRIALSALHRKTYFFHFGSMNKPPLKYLASLNLQRTVFCESDSYGFSKGMYDVTYINGRINRTEDKPTGGILLAFQKEWPFLDRPDMKHLPRYIFGPTRTREAWIRYIRENERSFMQQAFQDSNVTESEHVIVFILGYMGSLDYLASPETMPALFRETIDLLAECTGDVPVFIKPHIITDMEIVAEAISKYPRGKFIISYLHPTLLASRAILFIANYYSTTLADASLMNVPTIEYTEYADKALAVTEGRSMRPEYISHFIQRRPDELRRVLNDTMSIPKTPLPEGIVNDPSGFLEAITGHA